MLGPAPGPERTWLTVQQASGIGGRQRASLVTELRGVELRAARAPGPERTQFAVQHKTRGYVSSIESLAPPRGHPKDAPPTPATAAADDEGDGYGD